MGFGLLEGWRVIESEYWSVGKLYGALESCMGGFDLGKGQDL